MGNTTINRYLHVNPKSVGKGQDFDIGSILVSVGAGRGHIQVNSPHGKQKKRKALAALQSFDPSTIM